MRRGYEACLSTISENVASRAHKRRGVTLDEMYLNFAPESYYQITLCDMMLPILYITIFYRLQGETKMNICIRMMICLAAIAVLAAPSCAQPTPFIQQF